MAALCFRVLGTLEVLRGDASLPLGAPKQRALLALLLLDPGRVVADDRIVDDLWGAQPPGKAVTSMQAYVSNLRRVLEPERVARAPAAVLVRDGGGYRLAVDATAVDAGRFAEAVTQVRAHGAAQAWEDLVSVADEALGLWRGDPFPELVDAPAAAAHVAGLRELRRGLRLDRVRALTELGDHSGAIADSGGLIAEDPLQEGPWRVRMLALHRAGRTNEALAQFQELRDVLDEELGLEPGAETRALHEQILRDDVRPASGPGRPSDAHARPTAAAQAAPRDATPAAVLDAVGRQPTLRGRALDLELLTARLRTDGDRLVTLLGPGGVGKSRLAGELVRAVADDFAGGLTVVRLASVEEDAGVAPAVAAALGVQTSTAADPDADARSATAAIVAALGPFHVLLVLDNCEQVVPGVAALVAAVLDGCPGVRVLATSRQRLMVHGGHDHQLHGLATPEGDDLTAVAAAPAAELFVECAASADPGFVLDAATAPLVAQLTRSLDGQPLAIQLAGANANALGLRALVDHLETVLELPDGPAHLPARQRTLRSAIDWSYDRLDEDERAMLRGLAVLRGRFDLADAASVCGLDGQDVARAGQRLAMLVNRSLVVAERDGADVHYRMHEVLRLYAQDRLGDAGEHDQRTRCHAAWCQEAVVAVARQMDGPGELPAVQRLHRLWPDLRTAVEGALGGGDIATAARIVAPLHAAVRYRIAFWEANAWATRILEAGGASPGDAVFLHCMVGRERLFAGDMPAATSHTEAALELAVDARSRMAALYLAAVLPNISGSSLPVADVQAQLQVVADELDDAARTDAAVCVTLFAEYRGDHAGAVRLIEAVERAARGCGHTSTLAWWHFAMAEVGAGADPAAAIAHADATLRLARDAGTDVLETMAMVARASLLSRLGDPAEALRGHRVCVERAQRAGAFIVSWLALRNAAETLADIGEDETAAMLLASDRAATHVPPAYGEQADRLEVLAVRLRARLGDTRYEAAVARGTAAPPPEALAALLAADDGG